MLAEWIVRIATATIIAGSVTYYAPGVMERVYTNRLSWNHVEPCEECIGMIAVLDREHIGKRAWLRWRNHPQRRRHG